MKYIPTYFALKELVCPDVFNFYGETAWQFFDDRLLNTLDLVRDKLNKPIFVNNWYMHDAERLKAGLPLFDERGLRCLKCSLVQGHIIDGTMYCSPHLRGVAADFDVEGMNASEVRLWLAKNEAILPWPVRLEANVDWVHLDTVDVGKEKVFLFKS
jgi:hypothetical protein